MTKTATIANSPWASVRDRASEREEKREAVLHAAAQAFSRNGYYRTSLDDIAERLGITKPTLYYYAKNKEDLIAAVMERALAQMLADLPIDPHSSAYDQLRVFLRNYAEIASTDFGICLVELSNSDLSDSVATRIRSGKAAIDAKLTAFMIAGAINGIGRWYREGSGLAPAAIAEIYVNQFGTGLRPR